ALPAVGAGAQTTVTVDGVVPAGTAAQAWALGAAVDPEKKVEQSERGNDVTVVLSAVTVTTAAAPPSTARVDLRPRALALDGDASLDPGAPVSVRVRVVNVGLLVAPAFETALLLSTVEKPTPRRRSLAGVAGELARV